MEALDLPTPIAGVADLSDGKVVLVYLDEGYAGGHVLESMRPDALDAAHPHATRLNSRAGKHFDHMVDAGAGIAWSEGEGRVIDPALFAPTDLDSYQRRFYEDPGFMYK